MKISVEEFVKRVKEHHSRYCDYPCFTTDDIINLLLVDRLGVGAIEKDEGTTITTTWGAVFGNLSYDHLIDSFDYVLREIKEKEGEQND